jgi:hypothetical protein
VSDRIISESAYEYVLFESAGALFLTFMVGGVIETDVTVQATPAEVAKLTSEPEYVRQLVRELQLNPTLLAQRRINPSVWPKRVLGHNPSLKADVPDGTRP